LNTVLEGVGVAIDQLSRTLSALADPTRRAILERLTHGDATVNELAEPFTVTLQAVSKHLKVLERAGLITRTRSAQWRPCRLRAEPLGKVNEYVSDYRRFWEHSFDRLDEHLRAVQTIDPERGTTDE
jgi:DNA-binding transcriptional ArsR family regulator